MTEALKDGYFRYDEPVEGSQRPELHIVDEPRPAFVRSDEDIAWWNSLPQWRQGIYLLPHCSSEAERVAMIKEQLGMAVVSYAGQPITHYRPE